jgi:iron-sulfur cluster assembly protein
MSETAAPDPDGTRVGATDRAASEALSLIDDEGLSADEAGLRLFVQQGGCAGLSYGMRFEHEPDENDEIFEDNGLRVIVDPASLEYVGGSVIDFDGGLQGEGFHVKNPNVESECGCGESFRA